MSVKENKIDSTEDVDYIEEDAVEEEAEDVNTNEKSSEGSEEVTTEETEEDKHTKKAEKKEQKRLKKQKKKESEKVKPEDVNIVADLLSLIIYIGIVVLLCYFVIHYVGCRSKVDGDSMNETLQDGDNLWVDKLSYTFGDPKRFDVIIFNYNEDTTYVKRIIGLPGETVRIDQKGNIYVDEQLLSEDYGNETITASHVGRAISPVKLGEDEYFVLEIIEITVLTAGGPM